MPIHESSVLHFFLNEGKRLIPKWLEGRQAEPTGSEIRRLFDNKAVVINGFAPPQDGCLDNQWPIWELVFFPKGKRRTTLVQDTADEKMPWFNCSGKMISGTQEEKEEWDRSLDLSKYYENTNATEDTPQVG